MGEQRKDVLQSNHFCSAFYQFFVLLPSLKFITLQQHLLFASSRWWWEMMEAVRYRGCWGCLRGLVGDIMKETLMNPIYLVFCKFCLKKDKLCDLMTNNSWCQINNLGFILQYVQKCRLSLGSTLLALSGFSHLLSLSVYITIYLSFVSKSKIKSGYWEDKELAE